MENEEENRQEPTPAEPQHEVVQEMHRTLERVCAMEGFDLNDLQQ